jgi:hypothetical protein
MRSSVSSLADAFKKVGLATEEQVEKIRAESRIKELRETDKFGESRDKPRPEVKAETSPDSRFTKLFDNEKSKKFIIHIIHAFTPFAKIHYVLDWELQGTKPQNCSICRRKTISKIEAMEAVHRQTKAWEDGGGSFLEFLEKGLPLAFKDSKLAAFSPDSKSIMCAPCFDEFSIWIIDENLAGNRLVTRILSKRVEEQWGISFSGMRNTDVVDFKKKEEASLQEALRKHQVVDLDLQKGKA